jgi:hypothetical protein
MAAVLMNHQVADFDAWVKVFEANGALRQQAGVTGSVVWQAADDPNNVFVLIKGVEPAKAQAFTQSAELQQAMQRAGVISQPVTTLLADGRKFPN